MESRKQLSNERFAEARTRQLARKYGAARIRHDLKSKGVSKETAERAVAELDDVATAKEILARKYGAPATSREERAKRARFLQSRGFSCEVVRRFIASFCRNTASGRHSRASARSARASCRAAAYRTTSFA